MSKDARLDGVFQVDPYWFRGRSQIFLASSWGCHPTFLRDSL